MLTKCIAALDGVHLRHSTTFPTLCTLTVDGQTQGSPVSPQPPTSANGHEWHLPSGDPRDEGRYLLRLHTLDIYFWTLDDANLFLDSLERVLYAGQIETDRHPQSTEDATSTVVQQLENVAITDPAYQNGQTRNSRSEPASLPPPQPAAGTGNLSHGGTPLQPVQPVQPEQTHSDTHTHTNGQEEPVNYTPLPYNPAAPAAPEPIRHREKTPPPVDGAEGTGLAAAAAADEGRPYASPSQLSGGFAPPPTSSGLSYPTTPGVIPQPGYMSPPPSAGLPPPSAGLPPHSAGLPPSAGFTNAHRASISSHSSLQNIPRAPSFAGPPVAVASSSISQPATMSCAPPPTQDPNAHLYAQQQQIYASHPQLQQQQQHNHPQYANYMQNLQNQHTGTPPPPAVPIGGYSTYSYDQPQRTHSGSVGSGGGSEYDIHSQVYRPTEAEAKSHYFKDAQKAMKNPGQRPGKLEDRAARVEKGVNRFLKKLEKRL